MRRPSPRSSERSGDLEKFLKDTRGTRGGRGCLFCKNKELAADIKVAVKLYDAEETTASWVQIYDFLADRYNLQSSEWALRQHVNKHVRRKHPRE